MRDGVYCKPDDIRQIHAAQTIKGSFQADPDVYCRRRTFSDDRLDDDNSKFDFRWRD